MAAAESTFLIQAATYLGAAVIAVPLFNRFKLGSILGYLAAGVVIGPSMLNILSMEEHVFHVAELGVVLFLFIIGLELSFARLWSLRRSIFGLGATQMAITAIILTLFFLIANVMPANAAIVAGISLAFSSTAFALQWMKDRGEFNSSYGERAFPVLLFQDIAVIPLLALIPFAAGQANSFGWNEGAKIILVLVILLITGKIFLNELFKLVASSGSREAFAALALFIVAATALAVSWAGLSMALGAFLAGVLLADSAYRHQIETDIEPFRGLLLGLFFISIGMRLDLSALAEYWVVVLFGALGLITIKTLILFCLSHLFGADRSNAIKTATVLSQGGEFAFVVFSLGANSELFTDQQSTLMTAIVTISMALTPMTIMLGNIVITKKDVDDSDMKSPQQDQEHIIIAGFGRMGQIISQILKNSGFSIMAIDNNPDHIHSAKNFGFDVYFGDASRLDVLKTAGAKEAKSIILCMDDAKAVNQAIKSLREFCPTQTILAVAHDRLHEIEIQSLNLDVDKVVRETLESSILISREALARAGFDGETIDNIILEFRARDRERFLAQLVGGAHAGKEFLHEPFKQTKNDKI